VRGERRAGSMWRANGGGSSSRKMAQCPAGERG